MLGSAKRSVDKSFRASLGGLSVGILAQQVVELFKDVKFQPKSPQQANWDAWDLRRLWTFLWRRSGDAAKRGQIPRDRALYHDCYKSS